MNDLAVVPTLFLPETPGVEVSSTALSVVSDLTFEDYDRLLSGITAVGDSVRWWVGDLLLFGEARYGEEYAQALDHLRLSERQAVKYRWVAQNVLPSRRRENLSFSHHEAVAALEPAAQDALLEMAAAAALSVASFREKIKDHAAIVEGDVPEPRGKRTVLPASEVDAARGLNTIRTSLRKVAENVSPEASEALDIGGSIRALDDVGKTVKRATALEPLALAVAAVIAAGVRQTGLPDPAIIVPAGPWDTLVAAYATATEGGRA